MNLNNFENQILRAFYEETRNNKLFSEESIGHILESNGVKYSSKEQVIKACDRLRNKGFISGTVLLDDKIIWYNVTNSGIKYVHEELYSNDEIKNLLLLENLQNREYDREKFYAVQPKYKPIKDKHVRACFGIDKQVDCFVKQLDKIADSDNENISMIGIFAPWGRGKSYFFNKVKEKISNKKDREIEFFITEFNAWKYQETPAIWAYLFETLYSSHKSKFWKILFSIKRRFPSPSNLIWFVITMIIALLSFYTLYHFCKIPDSVEIIFAQFGITLTWLSIVSAVAYQIISNPQSAYGLIRKYTQNTSYKNHLGLQNEIEKELEEFVKTIISKKKVRKKKFILYVDDIDRCSSEKMISIIDSLRTVLENPEIGKRLIVICSIDAFKLKQGLKHLYNKIEESNNSEKYAREQLDKIFIFSIGLAPLGLEYQLEFIRSLIPDNQEDTSKLQSYKYIGKTFNDANGFVRLARHQNNHRLTLLTDDEVYELMHGFLLKNQDIEFTPRKLKVLYYQLLFANNLFSQHENAFLSESLIEAILSSSTTGVKHNTEDIVWHEILNMVVPY